MLKLVRLYYLIWSWIYFDHQHVIKLEEYVIYMFTALSIIVLDLIGYAAYRSDKGLQVNVDDQNCNYVLLIMIVNLTKITA